MKKFADFALLGFFALFIWGLFLADLLAPTQEFSQMENRYLSQGPELTARTLFNNTYTLKYEEFVNDQFVGRDAWITLKSMGESALGKLENNGVVYGAEHRMFEEATSLDQAQLKKNIVFIADFVHQYGGERVTVTVVPNAYAVYPDKLPSAYPAIDQLGMIGDIYGGFAGESVCDIAPVLQAHREEYLYYRTDHHWTTLGAWYAYSTYLQSIGREPAELDSLTAHQVPDFYGTHYSKAKTWNAAPDVITWYDVPVKNVVIDGAPAEGIYDHAKWQERDKYAAFLWGNNGLTAIEGGGEGSLLLFKDSYGNSMVPFLAESFAQITVVDLRYLADINEVMQSDYDEIYILYNFATLTQDLHLFKLAA